MFIWPSFIILEECGDRDTERGANLLSGASGQTLHDDVAVFILTDIETRVAIWVRFAVGDVVSAAFLVWKAKRGEDSIDRTLSSCCVHNTNHLSPAQMVKLLHLDT